MALWRRRLMPLGIIIIFVGLTLGLLSHWAPKKETPPKPDILPLVEAITPTLQSHQVQLRSYGVLEPKQQTQLVAEVSGRLVQLTAAFEVGQFVQQGQLLAQIEPADYQTALLQAEANLAQARAQLQQEQAQGAVAAAQWRGVSNGVPPELGLRKPQLAQEQANVRSAEAALARAQRNLARTELRAPFSGIISQRVVDLGQYINIGTELGQVNGTQQARIRLPLSPSELALLPPSQKANVQLRFDNGTLPQVWQARIIGNEGLINADNRMIYLVAELDDPYNFDQQHPAPLPYGAFLTAEIQGRRLEQVLRLPRHAVRDNRVAIITAENTVELRPVTVVHADLEQVYVTLPFRADERLSLTRLTGLDNGRRVNVLGDPSPDKQLAQEPMAAPPTTPQPTPSDGGAASSPRGSSGQQSVSIGGQ
ncbi:MAG: efflux RND transporter periplasmic adaptor subunit [Ferrimonas sp.]